MIRAEKNLEIYENKSPRTIRGNEDQVAKKKGKDNGYLITISFENL